jgi:hypothetical protein
MNYDNKYLKYKNKYLELKYLIKQDDGGLFDFLYKNSNKNDNYKEL